MNRYHCTECGKTVDRESTALHIKSYCEQTGLMVLLVRCANGEGRAG